MPRFEPHPARRPAIVAGASSGIGAATAVELAAHGFPVALGARRVDKCEEIVDKIRADGGEAIAPAARRHRPRLGQEFVHRATERTRRHRGAGRRRRRHVLRRESHEIDTDTFESQVQIHLIGANRLAAAVLPGMVERRRGDVIFVGSDVALRQRPHMGAYGAAKAGLVAMAKTSADGTRGHRGARLGRASRARQ